MGITPSRRGKWFRTTRWSLVEAAADSGSPEYVKALNQLCQSYWPPVYAYVRSRGNDVDSSQDLTQGFFAQLLEKKYLKDVRRVRGRFRSFLLVCVKHYLANEWDRVRAQKRGAGQPLLSIDAASAESLLRMEPVEAETPEKLFARQWALTLLQRTMSRLDDVMGRSGGGRERFLRLRPFLTGDASGPTYKQVAEELKISEGAVKVAVHNLRRKFRNLLREEVAQTVSDPNLIDDEIRLLFTAFDP